MIVNGLELGPLGTLILAHTLEKSAGNSNYYHIRCSHAAA